MIDERERERERARVFIWIYNNWLMAGDNFL